MNRTRRKDGGWQTTEESGRVTWAGQEETREAKAEMEDCVKRDVKKTGEEGDWKKKTGDRAGWRRIADEAVKKLRAAPHPWQREKEEGRDLSIHVTKHANLIIEGCYELMY